MSLAFATKGITCVVARYIFVGGFWVWGGNVSKGPFSLQTFL